jgi:hypothetical protein
MGSTAHAHSSEFMFYTLWRFRQQVKEVPDFQNTSKPSRKWENRALIYGLKQKDTKKTEVGMNFKEDEAPKTP